MINNDYTALQMYKGRMYDLMREAEKDRRQIEAKEAKQLLPRMRRFVRGQVR